MESIILGLYGENGKEHGNLCVYITVDGGA